MDDARRKLAALSSAQTADVVRYDRELRGSVARAVQESAAASGLLLAVSVLAFLALNFYTGRLEIRAARRKQEHRAMALRLEQFTSTVFNHVRGLVKDTANHAHVLLDVYGGFLPRQGQERAERIEEGAGQMMRVLEELAGQSAGEGETVEVESQRLSA